MSNLQNLTQKKLWLAPLAGLTDRAFRLICKENGADVAVTEMVSSDGLIHDFAKSFQYAKFSESEKPLGIQLFGSNRDTMAQAAELLLAESERSRSPVYPSFIDINMGCPVKKVVKRNAGSALLKDLDLAGKIVSSVKNVLQGKDIFLSVKIRSGWDSNSIVAVEAAQIIADNGADIIIVHPRTRSQLYSGVSDWSVIRDVKKSVGIPVVGNGDIRCAEDAQRMFATTGCDSIMIGRGCLGSPWIFDQIKLLLTGTKKELSYYCKYKIVKKHFQLCIENKGKEIAVKEMKTHLCHYTKGIRGSSKVRNLLNASSDAEEMMKLLEELYCG